MSTGKNKYYVRSHISEKLFRRLIRIFALDLTASEAAAITGLSVRSVNTIYLKLRRQIARWCEAQNPLAGEVEVDESYFGPRRVRGKRGRGAGGKTIVFGIFQRNGYVYTQIVPDCRRKTLRKAILGRISLESIIHSDGWSRLRRPGRYGISETSPGEPRGASVCRAQEPRQWHRELLELRQTTPGQVQRHTCSHLFSPFKGNRISLQPPS